MTCDGLRDSTIKAVTPSLLKTRGHGSAGAAVNMAFTRRSHSSSSMISKRIPDLAHGRHELPPVSLPRVFGADVEDRP